MLFFNFVKIVNILKYFNMIFIENQLIGNNVITQQLHCYRCVITINEMNTWDARC